MLQPSTRLSSHFGIYTSFCSTSPTRVSPNHPPTPLLGHVCRRHRLPTRVGGYVLLRRRKQFPSMASPMQHVTVILSHASGAKLQIVSSSPSWCMCDRQRLSSACVWSHPPSFRPVPRLPIPLTSTTTIISDTLQLFLLFSS